jgi:hypothetical protein
MGKTPTEISFPSFGILQKSLIHCTFLSGKLEHTLGRSEMSSSLRISVKGLGAASSARTAFLPFLGSTVSGNRRFERVAVPTVTVQPSFVLYAMIKRLVSFTAERSSRLHHSIIRPDFRFQSCDSGVSRIRHQTMRPREAGVPAGLLFPLRGAQHNGGASMPRKQLLLAALVRSESREAAMARWLKPNPASMVYVRSESQQVKEISTLLHQLKTCISEIRLPAVPTAPEVDVRELTRNVYDRLERELRIDRERRGR